MAVYHQLTEGYHSSDSSGGEEQPGTAKKTNRSLKRSPSSYSDVNWKGDCDRLLRELIQLPDSLPFREPVDVSEFPDYGQVLTLFIN